MIYEITLTALTEGGLDSALEVIHLQAPDLVKAHTQALAYAAKAWWSMVEQGIRVSSIEETRITFVADGIDTEQLRRLAERAVAAWAEYSERTPFEEEMGALARLLSPTTGDEPA